MENYAIIVAGGSGSRMKEDVPKQFLLLAGLPLLMHSIKAFYKFNPLIQSIVALPEIHFDTWQTLCNTYNFHIPHQLSSGGNTRFHSVQNAMKLVPENVLVAVHDAARPLVNQELIQRTFSAAAQTGIAIPGISVNETVRIFEGNGFVTVDRSLLRIIQTPQVFDSGILKKAYEQSYQPNFTDDGSLLETMGMTLHLVEGHVDNIKITLPGDLEIAEVIYGRNVVPPNPD